MTGLALPARSEPLFVLAPAEDGTWALSGEVDIANAGPFAASLRQTAKEPWVVDVAGLAFVDVVGMRAISLTVEAAAVPLELRRTPSWLVRVWRAAGFHRAAPAVLLGR